MNSTATPEPSRDTDSNDVHTPQPGDIIRAKWVMDGATTLPEAAERLEGFAAYLRDLGERGWTLTEPIDGDYGFLVDPDGNAGEEDLEDDEADGDDDADVTGTSMGVRAN